MKKIVLLVAVLLTTISLFAKKESGGNEIIQVERTISAFSSLSVSGGIQVIFTEGNPKLLMEANEQIEPHIQTERAGHHLKIYRSKQLNRDKSLQKLFNKTKVIIFLQTANIKNLQISSGASFSCEALTTSDLHVSTSSGGTVKINKAAPMTSLQVNASSGSSIKLTAQQAQYINLNLSSGSKITLNTEGNTDKLSLNGSSGSGATVTATQIHSARFNLSSGANATIRTSSLTNDLEGDASSSANLKFFADRIIEADLDLSSGAKNNLQVSGTFAELEVEASSSSSFTTNGDVTDLDIDLSSGSRVTTANVVNLGGEISSGASISCTGISGEIRMDDDDRKYVKVRK